MKEKTLMIRGMIILVLTLLIINFVKAEMIVSEAGVEYDSEILGAFQNQTKIYVIVRLVDNSGIEIIGTKEKKIE